MPEKPKLKTGSANQQPQKKPSTQAQTPNIDNSSSVLSHAKSIPLIFQAQIEGRGNIQFVGGNKDKITGKRPEEKPGYERWVDQWLESCPPIQEISGVNLPQSKLQRSLAKLVVKLPEFGSDVHQWEYQIRWRIVMNSGQDSVIRPVIGKKGMPFFPGSSMKGAFRNACFTEDQRMRYCGGEEKNEKGEKYTKPGILRFHGGYPINTEWRQRDRLVDIAHAQEKYQVRDSEASHNANVQISLYRPKFKFGISSSKTLSSEEWEEIRKIWERALGAGIGSRVSAGYGYVENVQSSKLRLYSIHLKGQGITSQLLLPTSSKTAEFRPNMFKAALRGHTWRLLAGITDELTAQILVHKLWGGIDCGAVVGCIGVDFSNNSKLSLGEHSYSVLKKDKKTGKEYPVSVSMPIYDLKNGRLDLLQVSEIKPELKDFLVNLVKFSMLLGGFGKSWRRINHQLFYQDYFRKNDKPMIGCHWEFSSQSKEFYVVTPSDDLSEVKAFLDLVREQAIAWVQAENQPLNTYVKDWRETWHLDNVQVWGRIAQDGQSESVGWFHNTKYLKDSNLAGRIGQIGRTWHRMYPRYVVQDGKLSRIEKEYVELLTIFPDESKSTQQFLRFLKDSSGFTLLWGNKQS